MARDPPPESASLYGDRLPVAHSCTVTPPVRAISNRRRLLVREKDTQVAVACNNHKRRKCVHIKQRRQPVDLGQIDATGQRSCSWRMRVPFSYVSDLPLCHLRDPVDVFLDVLSPTNKS